MEQAVTTLNNVRNWVQERHADVTRALTDNSIWLGEDGEIACKAELSLLEEEMQVLGYRLIDGAWVKVVTDADGSTDCE